MATATIVWRVSLLQTKGVYIVFTFCRIVRFITVVLAVLSVGAIPAQAGVIFSEDFNSGLANPNLTLTADLGHTVTYSGGVAAFQKTAGTPTGRVALTTNFTVSGDFTATVVANRVTLTAPGDMGLVAGSASGFFDVFFFGASSVIGIVSTPSLTAGSVSDSATTVTLRLRRGGSTVFEEYDPGTGFVTVQSKTDGSLTGPVTLSLFLQQESSDTAAYEGTFDNFVISAPDAGGGGSFTYSGSALYGLGNPAVTGPAPCTAGDPVNCVTGNLVETATDLAVGGRGRALELVRTYNALDAASAAAPGPLGFGWTDSYAKFLSFEASGNVIVHQGNGSTAPFSPDGSGGFTAPSFVIATLVHNADGTYTFTLPDQRADIFSAAGRLLVETDRNGYQSAFAYDGAGRVVSATDPAGRALVFSYGSNGLLSSVVDPIGRRVSYGYDAGNNLVSVTDPIGAITQFRYDGSHRLTGMTDPNSGQSTNTYDSSNRVVSQTDPAGRTMTFAYAGTTTTITDGNGHVEIQTYTGNRLTSLTLGAGTPQAATWTYTYDAAGNRSSTTDPNGRTWHATYDTKGNPLTATDPLGRTTTSTYNARNDLTSGTDPLGIATTLTYDARGNLATLSRPLTVTGQVSTTTYQHGDPAHPGDVTAIIDPTGRVWSHVYDTNGNLVRSVDPAGDIWTGSYNAIGWRIGEVAPRGNAPGANPGDFRISRVYSLRRELLRITNPLGRVTTLTYDDNGNLSSVTDAKRHTTRYAYDPDNEIVEVTRADGTSLGSSYDAAGNLIGQTDGLGRTTTYTYDALNRRIQVTDPLGRENTDSYDKAGNLVAETNAAGQVITFTYDAANRLTGIAHSDGATPGVRFTYDADSQRTAMTDGDGTITYQYDSLHRLTASTDGAGNQVRYGHDLRNQLVSLTYPSANQVTRAYDPAGRLVSVRDWLGNTSSFRYDADGNLIAIDYPNGQAGAFAYDRTDRVVRMTYDRGGAGPHLEFDYTRDNLGLVSRVHVLGEGGEAKYAYTALDQLQATNRSGKGFAFDPADNLVQIKNAALTYDAANELISLGDGASASFSYDAPGNRVQATGPRGTTMYSYDQANRLVAFDSAAYAYNGDGLRISKTVDGALHRFVWDLHGRLPLILGDGQAQFIYGPNGVPFEQIGNDGSVLWFHQDQLGSTRGLSDSQGKFVAKYTYNAFGRRVSEAGEDAGPTPATPLLFSGQYTDAESRLQYLRARYYDPATGQFLTRDPPAAATRHPYLYANGDPINNTDPSGLCDEYAGGLEDSTTDLSGDAQDPLLLAFDNSQDSAPKIDDLLNRMAEDPGRFKVKSTWRPGEPGDRTGRVYENGKATPYEITVDPIRGNIYIRELGKDLPLEPITTAQDIYRRQESARNTRFQGPPYYGVPPPGPRTPDLSLGETFQFYLQNIKEATRDFFSKPRYFYP